MENIVHRDITVYKSNLYYTNKFTFGTVIRSVILT